MSRKKAHRHYTAEFKKSAVALVIEQNYTNESAGKSLGVPEGTIAYWVQRHHKRSGTVDAQEEKDLRKRVAELERENQRLRLEREILKKAAAFFAKEQP